MFTNNTGVESQAPQRLQSLRLLAQLYRHARRVLRACQEQRLRGRLLTRKQDGAFFRVALIRRRSRLKVSKTPSPTFPRSKRGGPSGRMPRLVGRSLKAF